MNLTAHPLSLTHNSHGPPLTQYSHDPPALPLTWLSRPTHSLSHTFMATNLSQRWHSPAILLTRLSQLPTLPHRQQSHALPHTWPSWLIHPPSFTTLMTSHTTSHLILSLSPYKDFFFLVYVTLKYWHL